MSLPRHGVRFALAGTLVLAAACQDAPSTGPAAPAPTIERATQQLDVPDPDALARTLPGFGGYFLGEGQRPIVYLTDVSQRAAAERAFGRFLSSRGLAPSDLRILRADYDWNALSTWFADATPGALAVDGAVFVDLDERANRVAIGVASDDEIGPARAAAIAAGVPATAITVRVVPPISFAATLRDQVRPVEGGLQINFSQFLCTLSFNAVHATGNSFIVNSHCTDRQGRIDGAQYFQPLASTAGSFIGTEVDDPRYFKGGACPRGRQCRFADVARASYAAGVPFTLGQIARTTGPNNGDLTIAGAFSITSEATGTTFAVGTVVNKVGRTTGWTQGQVTQTCVNTGVSGSNIVLLCQTFVAAGVGGGDSGSPVFIQTGASAVQLAGILWGGDTAGTLFVFSPLASIEAELGALTTF